MVKVKVKVKRFSTILVQSMISKFFLRIRDYYNMDQFFRNKPKQPYNWKGEDYHKLDYTVVDKY